MPRRDFSNLLERIHDLDREDDAAWFGNVAGLLLPHVHGRLGLNVHRFEPACLGSPGPYRITHIPTNHDCDLDSTRYGIELPPAIAHSIYGSGTHVHLAMPMMSDRQGQLPQFVIDDLKRMRAADSLGIAIQAGKGRGMSIAIPLTTTTLDHRTFSMLRHLAQHMASALRLRSHLARGSSAHAHLDIQGRLLHADGFEPTGDLRRRLRDSVCAREKARDACHREGPEALSTWHRLLAGEWTFLEQYEAGGRRTVIAIRNPPHTQNLRKLSDIEQAIVERIARSKSNKQVALELGLAEPTVANHLARALGKLGIPNRMAVIQTLATIIAASNTNSDSNQNGS
jgi:DNA-binding CsgD family transcriptional regulator